MAKYNVEVLLHNANYHVVIEKENMVDRVTFCKSVGGSEEWVRTINVPFCDRYSMFAANETSVIIDAYKDGKIFYNVGCYYDGRLYFQTNCNGDEPVVSAEEMEDHLSDLDEKEGDSVVVEEDDKFTILTKVIQEYRNGSSMNETYHKYGIPFNLAKCIFNEVNKTRYDIEVGIESKVLTRYMLCRIVCDSISTSHVLTIYNHNGTIRELADKLGYSIEVTLWLNWVVHQVI